MASPRLRAQSRLGVVAKRARRERTPQSQVELQEARRDYAAEALAEYVEKIIADFPPLTREQVDRIAVLLRPERDCADAS